MTTLTECTLNMRGRRIAPASKYPAMREIVKTRVGASLSEDDGLFVNYGAVDSPLPYTMLDSYDGEAEELEFKSLVLENEFLRAEFLPEIGGRLWRLSDRKSGRELVYRNLEFLPCNLAIRNAWVAGGIEYNFGRRGHDAQTSDSRFAAEVIAEDGTPVLRFYEFNRDRAVPFQMDFYLPADSRFLFCRVRIVNVHAAVVPMYYWANIALAEETQCRVLVPARETYTNAYCEGAHRLSRIAMPDGEGFDASYPARFPYSKDHFYRLDSDRRKFEAVAYPDGHAFVLASTGRLQGRKLFVWGRHSGGLHWQHKLTALGAPPYLEIQGGLARTQMECLPMPPETAWEHVEAYGACRTVPDAVTGDWFAACDAMEQQLDRELPLSRLTEVLEWGKHAFALKPGRILHRGSGWGALEEIRQRRLSCRLWPRHLDFGEPGPEQQPWLDLLDGKDIPEILNGTYLVRPPFDGLSAQFPSQSLHRGLCAFQRGDFAEARRSVDAAPGKTAVHAYVLGEIAFADGDNRLAAQWMFRALALDPGEPFLLKEALKIMLEAKEYTMAVMVCEELPARLRRLPMVRFLYASALAHIGREEEAEALLLEDGGLEIPDIREGENSVSQLWILLQRRKGTPDAEIQVPARLDLRMSPL